MHRNQKYITYYIAVTVGPSQGNRQHEQNVEVGRVIFFSYEQRDRQGIKKDIQRHADYTTSHSYWGQTNTNTYWKTSS